MKKNLLKGLVLLFFFFSSLHAELEWVSLKWTSTLCLEKCVEGLVEELKKVNGVGSVDINQSGGFAILHWKPDFPFSYYAIHAAMSKIGLNIRESRVRVRGTISHSENSIMITSLGDNTAFTLIGPTLVDPVRYVIPHNVQNHPLPETTKTKLLEAESNGWVVIIEGSLFEPHRSPPLYVILSTIQTLKPEENK